MNYKMDTASHNPKLTIQFMKSDTPAVTEPVFEIIAAKGVPVEGVEPAEVLTINTSFMPLWESMQAKMKAALAVVDDSKAARRARLDLVPVRTGIDKLRLSLNEEAKRKTKAINGLAAALTFDIETQEKRLLDIEEAAARAEAARLLEIRNKRMAILTPLITSETVLPQNVETLTDEQFGNFVKDQEALNEIRVARAAKEKADKEAADRKAEEERLAAEAERVRIAEENARLKAEAEEREAAAKAEREAAAAKLKAEQEAAAERERAAKEQADKAMKAEQARADAALAAERAKAERERLEREAQAQKEQQARDAEAAKAKAEAEAALAAERAARAKAEKEAQQARDAEAAKEREAKLAAERAAAAPDKEKLAALAVAIRALTVPRMSSRRAIPLMGQITDAIEALAARVDAAAAAI